ncbi:kinase-like domain-containing protein [Delphinella strobiligena]|nr:kinase-like domain-containing protein [Delphinella strobiligena]
MSVCSYASPAYHEQPREHLFREVNEFEIRRDGTKSKYQREAETLIELRKLESSNIIDVVFAFQETISRDKALMHLVFPFYQVDLQDYLYNRSYEEVSLLYTPTNSSSKEPMLKHPLWLAIMGVVEAVRDYHGYSYENKLIGSREWIEGVHSDIKPANIVVDTINGRLFLTNFGNAEINHSFNGQGKPTEPAAQTYNYAPPESDSDSHTADLAKVRDKYDVWSLGCVLLEVLVFLTQTVAPPTIPIDILRDRAVNAFYEGRAILQMLTRRSGCQKTAEKSCGL